MRRNLTVIFILTVLFLPGCAAVKTIVEGVEEMNQAAGEAAPDMEEDLEKAVEP